MKIPPGFEDEKTIRKVCKLKKALYGLKQSPRVWFDRFSKTMISFGYCQSNANYTLFMRHRRGKITLLTVYVDDIVVTGDNKEEMALLKERLAQEFEIKDLGMLKYFLGIEVARSDKGIFISQRKYILDLLEETGMLGCKLAESPIEANHKVQAGVGKSVNLRRYQRRSTSGYCTFVGGNLITWRSKKQNVTARSSTKRNLRQWLKASLQSV
ncbi:uncharacterized mitochondrial protein AtMg00810-like [Hevea brasiliensis]|uniref:uncharacterized mitochondrial protein AtMg00810-like n=1 Tax=Hevea brasiliensis TaxID=3981 RepID=UPI0025E9CD5E|nr:uncharacterized mitochondrial protein AtMg00810-like [Hevea brasiliensis]